MVFFFISGMDRGICWFNRHVHSAFLAGLCRAQSSLLCGTPMGPSFTSQSRWAPVSLLCRWLSCCWLWNVVQHSSFCFLAESLRNQERDHPTFSYFTCESSSCVYSIFKRSSLILMIIHRSLLSPLITPWLQNSRGTWTSLLQSLFFFSAPRLLPQSFCPP